MVVVVEVVEDEVATHALAVDVAERVKHGPGTLDAGTWQRL